jgi:hypothetical protein
LFLFSGMLDSRDQWVFTHRPDFDLLGRWRGLSLRGGGLRLLSGGRRRSPGFTSFSNPREYAVDRYSLAFVMQNLQQDTSHWCGHFGVYLVGRNFEQRFVAPDCFPDLLQPFDNRALGNGFAHLGHYNICSHSLLLFRLIFNLICFYGCSQQREDFDLFGAKHRFRWFLERLKFVSLANNCGGDVAGVHPDNAISLCLPSPPRRSGNSYPSM